MRRSIRLAPVAALAALLAACSGGGERPSDVPVGADPVISTRGLEVMLTGLAVQVQLDATVAAPPAMWTFDPAPPSSLSWLSLSIDGLLSGTPPAVLMPAEPVTVRVTDAARHTATVTLAVEVHGCDPVTLPTTACFTASTNACVQGTAYCSNGVFGACTGGGSSDARHCGPTCGPCGDQADNCHGGDTCRCGTGAPCSGDHTSASRCSGGTCVNECARLWGDCDDDRRNGCETALTSATHCGACGAACDARPNAGARCSDAGACLRSCASGFADCDSDMERNGCEASLTSSAHCGACNAACTPTANTSGADCSTGTCLRTCSDGYGDCDGDTTSNGCETRLNSLANCGGCGVACTAKRNTGADCSTGACTTPCGAGWGDCNGDLASPTSDGCETRLSGWSTSTDHCGACGNRCVAPLNGTATCEYGQCVPHCPANMGVRVMGGPCVCNSGLTPCGSPTNCVNIAVDIDHCGGCGKACRYPVGGYASCSLPGICSRGCPNNQVECNGVCVTGTTCPP